MSSQEYGVDFYKIIEKLGPCPGNREDYHIDHITPCFKFDHTNPEEVAKCWSPDNMQWLRKDMNLSKGAKDLQGWKSRLFELLEDETNTPERRQEIEMQIDDVNNILDEL
jgi:hypothetical protein